ncbi:adenosylcobinamide-GDP ribazoletransferase [Loktanella sp. Alg231-35]|uniref:adenosylcobinamide-GDP ribazoletransferase n=1 Tax=Loktanella sp. Alg231-35 TaxID=1922220 RepID=UPI000D550129|nr:adenosylcobinamide-GDP ribazoletransferase [Loktanella sp. Alg231-35]
MFKHDTRLIAPVDLPAALGLLTRLPIIVNGKAATARGAAAAWAYPLAGVVIGVILAAVIPLLLWVGVPGGITAGLVLAMSVILTGAMHEDGLADSADGLWGGWTKSRRLEIMKDSHIGVYGVCAIALSLLIRWLALVVIISVGAYWVAFIAVGALSRASMVVMMAVLPNARGSGLSSSVGRPPEGAVWLAIAIASVFAALSGMIALVLVAAVTTAICGAIAKAKIGGQTGDILGATQQVTEMAMLIAVVVMVT